MKVFVSIVAGVIIISSGSAVLYLAGRNPTSNRDPTSDEMRPHRTVVKGIGYVEPISEVRNLSFKVGGVVRECCVELGQEVDAGDVLMVLDNAEQMAALAVAENKVKLAEAQLEKTLSGVNPHEIGAAEWALELARERMEHAETEFTRRQTLLKDNAVSRSEHDAKESLFRQAQADLRRAEEQLQCLKDYVTPEVKLVAEEQLKVALVQRDLAAQGLANTQLLAPFDGTVLEVLRNEGEAVSFAYLEPVILFADISRLRVRAEIDERYLALLRRGQKVIVTGRALGGSEYHGQISRVKDIMGKKTIFTRSSSEKRDLDIVQVFVDMGKAFRAPAGVRVDVAVSLAPDD